MYLSSDCCRKGDPFQGPKLGSCLTLGNELYEETHVLTKQEILLGKGTWVESSRVREPRRTAWLRGSQSRVLMVMGLVSRWSLANHSNSESFLVAHGIASERDSGKWMDTGCLLSTLPELSHWWWLISSIFLIRISCHKTTHANGYYGAWPGWVVSISVLPLT